MQITFPKNPTFPKKINPPEKPAENKAEPPLAKPAKQSVPVATALRTVNTEALENSVAVKIEADGTINKYKAFTLINPDRIVFDLYDIKSPKKRKLLGAFLLLQKAIMLTLGERWISHALYILGWFLFYSNSVGESWS